MRKLLIAAFLFLLTACFPTMTSITTRGCNFSTVSCGKYSYKVEVSPYINAMPGIGDNAKDFIIPIQFECLHPEKIPWPNQFRMISAEIRVNKSVVYSGKDFDHNNAMHIQADNNGGNVLRLNSNIISGKFDLTLAFKSVKRNCSFTVTWENLEAGKVY